MSPIRRLLQIGLAALPLATVAVAQTGFPFENESLHYNINWPGGLGIGKAVLTAQKTASGWDFAMNLSGSIPAFSVTDKFHASATADLCSAEFQRDLSQGSRESREKTTFDQQTGRAHRVTLFPAGGGHSDFDIASCARDVLTFVYFARRELGQGRVPPQQQVYYGGTYSIRMEYAGAQTIASDGKPTVTDRLLVHWKGPQSSADFDVFFARDAARTPLSVKVPLSAGAFSLELVP
jgi:hypothetical protein